jgi:hypothetical protein
MKRLTILSLKIESRSDKNKEIFETLSQLFCCNGLMLKENVILHSTVKSETLLHYISVLLMLMDFKSTVFHSDVKISVDIVMACIKFSMNICFIRTLVS